MSRRENEHTELAVPNGWFAVAFSKDLVPGDVRRIHYFGEELVLFRTREGVARVLDAYCAHLGAHLAEGGRVFGETVRCPFHGWQYDGADGRCVAIPYCERIPPRARVRAWPVAERNAMIFVWHHAEGLPPAWEVTLMPEIGHSDWTVPRCFELEVPVHVQDMHENNNDPVHFQFVHGMLGVPDSEISYSDGGRHMRMEHESDTETPYGTFRTALIRDSWGIGLSAVRTTGIPGTEVLLYSSTTPIERNLTISRWLLTATKGTVDVAGEELIKGMTEGVMQDLRIWANKVHRAQPVLCEADTYLGEFRQWVKQFYSGPV